MRRPRHPGEAGTARAAPRIVAAAQGWRRAPSPVAPAMNAYRGPPMTVGNAAAAGVPSALQQPTQAAALAKVQKAASRLMTAKEPIRTPAALKIARVAKIGRARADWTEVSAIISGKRQRGAAVAVRRAPRLGRGLLVAVSLPEHQVDPGCR
jgi:hypothetical protein